MGRCRIKEDANQDVKRDEDAYFAEKSLKKRHFRYILSWELAVRSLQHKHA
jgi:hypothetical protein